MKTESASLLLLAALTLAEELTPNDVPIACANICGPIVELSFKCDVDGTDELRKLKRRKLSGQQQQQQQQQRSKPKPKAKRQAEPEPLTTTPSPTNDQQAADVIFIPGSIGKFKTIPTPSPGTAVGNGAPSMAVTPSAPLSTPALDLRPTTTPTNLNPNLPPIATPVPPSASSPTPVAPPLSTTNVPLPVGDGGDVGGDAGDGAGDADPSTSLDGDVGDMVDDAGNLWPGQKGRETANDLETACLCSNDSFNVRRVAGLCADCLEQVSGDQGPMGLILTSCNFTSERYEPATESLVANVRVSAAKPSFSQAAAAPPSRVVGGLGWAVVGAGMMTLGMGWL
ncbi:hypothetical protein ACHAQA_006480 [Verticillium albo-atrum]